MPEFNFKGKTYLVDSEGFLMDYSKWDKDFAEGMAPRVQITQGLTKEHWDVINSIREMFNKTGKCPLVYETCRMNGLHLSDLKKLFPTGYLRGVCKLAGFTYKEGYMQYSWQKASLGDISAMYEDRIYRVDIRGFLIDPSDWDENYAQYKAHEMKIPGKLTEQHFKIIRFLRDSYQKNKVVPSIYETCEINQIDIEELERLFPDGYHRGAVKIAGLRVR